VRDADDLIADPEGEQQLGSVWHETDDSHLEQSVWHD
jgi:hypothetical protein